VDTKIFMGCVQDLFLTQCVNCLTTDRSVLDLVMSKKPDLSMMLGVLASLQIVIITG